MTTTAWKTALIILLLASECLQAAEFPLFGRIEDYSKLHKKAAEQTIQPLKGTIDPDTYILGPMDEITVQVWKEPFETYVSLVNAEGILIFEGIGSLAASGRNLSEARNDIGRLFSSKFRESVKITSCLSGLRPILFDVVGAVRAPGTYELVAQDRLIQALRKAGGLREFASLGRIEIHRNGEVEVVAFDRFLGSADEEYNPVLYEGDRIFVPRFDRYVVFIGAVHPWEMLSRASEQPKRTTSEVPVREEAYREIAPGEDVIDLLNRVSIYAPAADLEGIWIAREPETGGDLEVIGLDLSLGSDGRLSGRKVALMAGDRIMVPELVPSVYIMGLVEEPGVFDYNPDLTIFEYVVKAGGVSHYGKLSEMKVMDREGRERKAGPGESLEMGDVVIVTPTFSFYLKEYLTPILSLSGFILSLYLAAR